MGISVKVITSIRRIFLNPKALLTKQTGFIPLLVLVVIGAVSVSGATVVSSQGSVPGDALYSVKKASENVRVAAAFSEKSKAKVHLAIAEEKLKEIEKLENRGRTEKIAETAQQFEVSQREALELTQTVLSEGESVDELVTLLEVNRDKQQVVLTRVSVKVPEQARQAILKSLEDLREEFKKAFDALKEQEQKEADEDNQDSQDSTGSDDASSSPCPTSTPSPEDANNQEDEDTSSRKDLDIGNRKYEDLNVQGVNQLRQLRNNQYGYDSCNSTESNSQAGSKTFDGGAETGTGTVDFGDGAQGSPSDQQEPAEEPTTNASPEVEGATTTGGFLQLILGVLFKK